MDASEKMGTETHKMVSHLHHALMEPQIGQGDKSLVERFASVTVDIESGRRTTDNMIAIARRLIWIASILAALAALFKFGTWDKL